MTYTELQTAVQRYFNRGDIASRIPSWITLAEAFLFREINPKAISSSVTGTTVGGLIALPADFNSVVRVTVTVNGSEWNLDYIAAPSEFAGVNGYPEAYSMEGDSIRLHPAAGDGTAYKLYYTPKLQNLSGSVADNWLSINASDLYMYCTALQGAVELKNDGEVVRLTPVVERLLSTVRNFADQSAQPKSSGMQIKPRRGF